MTEHDFCVWLTGFFEVHSPGMITHAEVERIRQRLSKVENQPEKLAALRSDSPSSEKTRK